MVYKKYKHVINKRTIFLQHEYEDYDDVAKVVVCQQLMSFCTFIESVQNSFTVDLYNMITNCIDTPLTSKVIGTLCLKALNESSFEHER